MGLFLMVMWGVSERCSSMCFSRMNMSFGKSVEKNFMEVFWIRDGVDDEGRGSLSRSLRAQRRRARCSTTVKRRMTVTDSCS